MTAGWAAHRLVEQAAERARIGCMPPCMALMLLHSLGLVGLYVFRYAFHVVPRDRCLCGYDLRGTPPHRPCAECGRAAGARQRLREVRIRWLPFVAALLLVIVPIAADATVVLVVLDALLSDS